MILVISSRADLESQEFPSSENTIHLFYSIPRIFSGVTSPLADFCGHPVTFPDFWEHSYFCLRPGMSCSYAAVHAIHRAWVFSSKFSRPFILYLWVVTDLPFTVMFSCPYLWCCKFQSFPYLFPQIQKLSCLSLSLIVSTVTCPAYACHKKTKKHFKEKKIMWLFLWIFFCKSHYHVVFESPACYNVYI